MWAPRTGGVHPCLHLPLEESHEAGYHVGIQLGSVTASRPRRRLRRCPESAPDPVRLLA